MERNTIQIQHKKFRISNLQKFDLTGFCLPYFNWSTVCWTRVRSVPESWPSMAFYSLLPFSPITSGSPIVGLQMSCMFKIEGRQSIKSIEIYWSEITALGCSQAQASQRNNPETHFCRVYIVCIVGCQLLIGWGSALDSSNQLLLFCPFAQMQCQLFCKNNTWQSPRLCPILSNQISLCVCVHIPLRPT